MKYEELNLDEMLKGVVKVSSKEKKERFIKKCESFYGKTTEQFLKEFKENDYEGNVDFKNWYEYVAFLKEIGEKNYKDLQI